MTDQHRLDHVGFALHSRMPTPNIDRIAESVGFIGCITPSPMCQPARAALMTGKYPHQIGMNTMSGDLSQQHPTFARALQGAGYHTACIGKLHLLQGWDWYGKLPGGHNLVKLHDPMRGYGFDELWEVSGKLLIQRDYCDYADHLHRKGLLEPLFEHLKNCGGSNFMPREEAKDRIVPFPLAEDDYVDMVTAEKIIASIRQRDQSRPFCLVGSFCGPHVPYDPPQRYLDMFADEPADPIVDPGGQFSPSYREHLHLQQKAYKAMVRLIDDQIGRILDVLQEERLWDDTVVIFASDHGEMLGDHYRLQKGFPQWQSLAVPLAIRHPEYSSRCLNASPVELTDVTATILDVAGLDPRVALSKTWPSYHSLVPCRSLMPIVRGEREAIRDFAFAESDANWHSPLPDPESCWRVIQTQEWKYLRFVHTRDSSPSDFSREELYYLPQDPDELKDRAADPACASVLADLRNKLDFVLSTTPPAQTSWAPLEEWRSGTS